ncbi:hypothetical protein D3C87_983160 [compost metagenome]
MIRVGDNSQDPKLISALTGLSSRNGVERASFNQQLQGAQHSATAQTLQGMIEKIDAQAQRLLKHPVPGEVAAYREAVRRFMKEANERLGKAEKRTDRRNRTLILLREVDAKLAKLVEDVLEGQVDPMALAASINELRGMLTDLFI